MKRSEIIEHIAAEIVDAATSRKYSHEAEEAYYKRKANYILDMLEGFGMQPPTIKEFVEISPHNILGAGFKVARNVNKWEPEDE